MFNSLESKLKGSAYGWKRKLGYFLPWELPRLLQPRESHTAPWAALDRAVCTSWVDLGEVVPCQGSEAGADPVTSGQGQHAAGAVEHRHFPKIVLPPPCSTGADESEGSSSGVFDSSEAQVPESTSCTWAWSLQHFHVITTAAPQPITSPACRGSILSSTERVDQVPFPRKLLLAGSWLQTLNYFIPFLLILDVFCEIFSSCYVSRRFLMRTQFPFESWNCYGKS